jgi:dihydroorotate dehydrogenase electron transfer subunit
LATIEADLLRPTIIEKVVDESSNIRSFYFQDKLSLRAKPGQFAMVWLPGAGEFPMSLSLPDGKLASIGVKAMGVGSKLLYQSRKGTEIGIRGPYGNPFDFLTLNKRKVLLVGGGTGLVPILVLANSFSRFSKTTNISVVMSAKTSAELPFMKKFNRMAGGKSKVYPTTDDGSLGFKGLGHERVRTLVEEDDVDEIFCCGPEKMMFEVYKIASRKSIPVQLALERIMKCGLGICGSCTVGELVLCKDGPVLDEQKMKLAQTEFGKSHRDKTGTLSPS